MIWLYSISIIFFQFQGMSVWQFKFYLPSRAHFLTSIHSLLLKTNHHRQKQIFFSFLWLLCSISKFRVGHSIFSNIYSQNLSSRNSLSSFSSMVTTYTIQTNRREGTLYFSQNSEEYHTTLSNTRIDQLFDLNSTLIGEIQRLKLDIEALKRDRN